MRNKLANLIGRVGGNIDFFSHRDMEKDCNWKCSVGIKVSGWFFWLTHKVERK